MPATDPREASLIARAAAHHRWARCTDRVAATAPARAASMGRFDRIVDPTGQLAPAERARRAENAKRAYFIELALKSARARRKTTS